jgi:hypothetical protein
MIKQPPMPAIVTERILRYFNMVDHPVFLGHVAVEIGYSLARTEEFVNKLVDKGVLRHASREEVKFLDGEPGSNVFVLVSGSNLQAAHRH